MSNYKRKYNPLTNNFDYVYDVTLLKVKGAVATTADLPLAANIENDCYIVRADDHFWTWNKSDPTGLITDWVDTGLTTSIAWTAITSKPSSSVTDIDAAVSCRHDQNSDTKLDDGGANEISASQIPKKATADVTYYIDATNGDDSNPGTDVEPFLTIQHAIDLIPLILIDKYYQIILKPSLAYAGDVNIFGFQGGYIDIHSQNYDNTEVLLTSTTDGLFFDDCDSEIYLNYISVKANANNAKCFRFAGCGNYAYIYDSRVGDNGNTGTQAIQAYGSTVYLDTITNIDANKCAKGLVSRYSRVSVASTTLSDIGDTASDLDWGSLVHDNIEIKKADYDSAVSLKHTQGTDTALGTMASNINMNSHKLTSLSVPASNGDSIRATTKITEANLETAYDHTQDNSQAHSDYLKNDADDTTSGLLTSAKGFNISTKKITVVEFTSAGINAAIDSLGADGGEVYLPEADYDIIASIVIDYDNTTLRGSGKGTRLLATNRFVYTTVTGTPAAGETLIGDTNSYTATVVQVDTTNKIVWYHTLSNAANYADGEVISWSGGADTTISGVPTEQSFMVIDTNDKDYVNISDLCIYGGSGGGNSNNLIGDGDNANFLTIKNNWLYRSDFRGCQCNGSNVTILNNYFEGNDKQAILIEIGDYSKVSLNTIKNNLGDDSIFISGSSYSEISGNTIEDAKDVGIHLRSSYSSVIGNVVKTSIGNGIKVGPGSNYSEIVGNVIYDAASAYASIKIIEDYILISNNICIGSGATNQGIYLDEADYCTVIGNFTSNHDVAGIQEDSDCQNNLIYGNNCQDAVPYIINGTAHESLITKGGLIGTLLQVAKDGDAYITLQNLTNEHTDGAAETRIIFEDHGNNALAQIQGSHDGTSDDYKGDLILYTNTGAALTEALRLDSAQKATFAGAIDFGGSTRVASTVSHDAYVELDVGGTTYKFMLGS